MLADSIIDDAQRDLVDFALSRLSVLTEHLTEKLLDIASRTAQTNSDTLRDMLSALMQTSSTVEKYRAELADTLGGGVSFDADAKTASAKAKKPVMRQLRRAKPIQAAKLDATFDLAQQQQQHQQGAIPVGNVAMYQGLY